MTKHKKWVICIGYSGRGYFGMQRLTKNNKVIEEYPTIENELFKAFFNSGMINEDEFNNPSLLRFQRAARTDKGVSAIKQIVSMNVAHDVMEFIPKLNEILPQHIRIFGAKRVTKYFDSKNFCDARTYSYMMPSFSICPLTEMTTESFRISKETIIEFNSILSNYIGTHNFHNFTSQKKPTDASAKRYITSFECSEPFLLGNDGKKLEFLVARVKGQSFMLHQIRKMMGLAISISRGFTDKTSIKRAFGLERLDIPIAPGLGLLLEEVHYEKYNRKYGGDGIHEPILWDEYNDQIYEFKNKFIYPDIVQKEIEELSMMKWLDTLPIHTFDVRISNNNDQLKEQAKEDQSSLNHNNDDNGDDSENLDLKENESDSIPKNSEAPLESGQESESIPDNDDDNGNEHSSKRKRIKIVDENNKDNEIDQ